MNVEPADIRRFTVNHQQFTVIATVIAQRLPPAPALKALQTDAGGPELAAVLPRKDAA